MQREVKFRAKQGKIIQHFPIKYGLTDWIYGWLHCSFDGSFFTYISNINDEKMETETYAVESSTVCENTGLKDKNGKEIYENDIILYNSDKQRNIRSFKAIVKFYKGSFIAEKIGSKKKNYCSFLLLSEKHIEIIGNHFDNPKLLSE